MSYKKIVSDGFVRDEEGKWNIVPLKLPGAGSAKKSSEKKKERKFIPIERIPPPPSVNLQGSPQNEPKRRKIEEPVRKELFKDPQRRSRIGSRSSIITRQSKNFKFTKTSRSIRISPATKRETSKPCILPLSDGSPLLDIDEAEELLMKLPVKSPTIPILKISKTETVRHTPEKQAVNEQTKVTPSSNESVNEFIEIEKNLTQLIGIENKTESPMATVCNLLQNAKIKNSGRKRKQSGQVLNELNNLFEKCKSEFYNLKQQITAYNNLQEEHFNKMANLLKQLESDECDKENQTRRSNRIAAQVTITKEKTKFVVSPAISKKVDLRKTTLNNNLTKTLQTDTQSPRMRRAVDMYNTIRSDYSVLCTPKLDRNAIDVQQSSVTRSLSRRLQKQCLLLQDTPKPIEY